ncbi:hypothetical protein Gotri_015632 [Gossypium trilobum]|uniref:Uncharacterized protein n=4 Tax=Gossypium TaxID=3633 RepID=A0A7J9E1F5_9ROSI|nr:hypothetical protein [Gossypium aridum]MBA0712259.1 hypothetical protein [Gossypium laxum]MBA0766604.1 hypothetical protein [Gossypium trilobum]MBA0799430.1 hypothetical protein [Gossypium harknessii]
MDHTMLLYPQKMFSRPLTMADLKVVPKVDTGFWIL